MKKIWTILVLLSLSTIITLAQNVGDQATAGFSNQRTYLNSDAGKLKPPFVKLDTIDLSSVITEAAESLAVFENLVLVGEGGDPTSYSLRGETDLWTATVSGIDAPLDYVPAYSNDIVLLGGPATSTVKAVRVSSGLTVWEDTSVGSATGRYPILTDNMAIYHGESAVVASDATTSQVFWRHDTTTAEAPLALYGRQVYLLQKGGILQALDLRSVGTASVLWVTAVPVGSDGSSIIATEKYVFVSDPVAGTVTAVSTADGSVIWTRNFSTFGKPTIALAYDQLLVFYGVDQQVRVGAYDPDTAGLIWDIADSEVAEGTAEYGLVANNVVYFYNTATNRVRALDAFSGKLLWSIHQEGVHGLTVASNFFLVLTATQLDIYDASNTIYLAQIADGQGASTLITVNNLAATTNDVTVSFFDSEGEPLEIEVLGEAGAASSVKRTIPANGSVGIQTLGISDPLVTGWATAVGEKRVSGAAIFQFGVEGDLLFEAGVLDSPASGQSNVLASRFETAALREVSTGVAIANPLDETANVKVTFQRVSPSTLVVEEELQLESHHHEDLFVQELFPDEAILGSEGTLIITSDIPVVVTALRTQGGYQMSSYPVGQPVR
jgi:outer membrane protein assembly factor BamB